VGARLRWTALLAAALALVAPLAASAQGNGVLPRITDRVDVTRLSTLAGNTYPLARPQFDQGAAPPDLPMNRMMLVLKRSPAQEAALQDLLTQQQDTLSPNYHKWLTPDQFGQQFGPADADIQAITSWLASFGFQSIKVSRGRTVIEFSGTASQVETALHTPIHRYVVRGESHWANANDPQIPAALAPVISGIVSLHNFRKRPAFVRSGRTATATVTPGARPAVNLVGGSHALGPADFNKIYNVAPTMTGANVTIGVIAHTNINVQDVHQFRSIFGLPINDPQVVLDGPDPGDLLGSDEVEAVLDATWSGAVAPNAAVKLVVSEDTNAVDGLDLSEIYIIDNDLADVMTESFSSCEMNFSTGGAPFYSAVAEQAAAQGITYLVASGDGGPDGCDDPSTVPTIPSAASVNLLAATPFTVAVGGTQFNDTASPSMYWQTSNGANSLSAMSYIPENVWNESCTVAQVGQAGCPGAGLWSSGGGQSSFFTKPPWQSGVTGIPPANSRFVPDVSLTAADHDGYLLCLDGSCQGSSPSFDILSGTSASAQALGGVMALVVQVAGRQGQANYVFYKLAAGETLSSCNGSNTTTAPNNTCIFNDTTVGNTNIPGETGFTAGTGYDEATGLGSVNVSNLVSQWGTAIVKASTTALTLNNGNPVTITHGQSVPVSITVSAKAPATETPTGDISLIANSSTGQGADGFTLTGGAVNTSTIFLPGGTYGVTAHYAGDGTFLGSDSNTVNVTVNPEASLTALGIVTNYPPCTTATTIAYGSPYILSVAVADSAGTGSVCLPFPTGASPTGTVTLTDTVNGVTSPLDAGTFKLNSAGYFEDQPIQLAVGTHNIKAAYAGDNSFNGSSSTVDVTVTQSNTSTTITTPATTIHAGQQVTVSAFVDSFTSSNPSGGSSGVNMSGTVTFTTPTRGAAFRIAPPTRTPNWLMTGMAATLEILFLLFMRFPARRRWGVALATMLLAAVSLTSVSCGSGGGSNSGGGTTTLGTQALTATKDSSGFVAGQASITITPTATETVTATYGGDSNYKGSTSSSVTITVQ
jgi:subtilase family serine protease